MSLLSNNIKINTNQTNKNNFVQCMEESETIILSIIIVSKGLVNMNTQTDSFTNIESKDDLVLLNITHTDSYLQNIESRLNSMYKYLGAKYIFPLEIWKNNILNTKLSTSNINRHIYNKLVQTEKMEKLKVNIMIDNLQENIPKYNYVLSSDIVDFFTHTCSQLNLLKIYFSKWIEILKTNQIDKLVEFIKSKYNITNPLLVQNSNLGMGKNQIKYFRQYGIIDYYNKKDKSYINTRKRKRLEEIKQTEKIKQTEEIIKNEFEDLVNFNFNYDCNCDCELF